MISEGVNLGRVTEKADGTDGVIRSAVYKRPVVNLAPELPEKDVFAIGNRAINVKTTLHAKLKIEGQFKQ